MLYLPPEQRKAMQEQEEIKNASIVESATTFGVQSGLHWRSKQINFYLEEHQKDLDQIYNFNRLMLDGNITPPVVREIGRSSNIDSPNSMRMSDKTIEII